MHQYYNIRYIIILLHYWVGMGHNGLSIYNYNAKNEGFHTIHSCCPNTNGLSSKTVSIIVFVRVQQQQQFLFIH